jgi:FAD/FMN-containing dehydrogenase
VCIGKGQPADAFQRHGSAITDAVYDVVGAMSGSFSAEHGVGLLKRDALRSYVPALDVRLMHRLKDCFDPAGIFNPGKVLGDPADGR